MRRARRLASHSRSVCPSLLSTCVQALAAKTRGNDAFSKGDYAKAVTEFSEAITHDPTDAVFYSNRSGAYASLKKFDEVRTHNTRRRSSGSRAIRRSSEQRRSCTLTDRRFPVVCVQALADANKCVELKPDFVKGYSRQGVALFGLDKLDEAKAAYEAGLKVDSNAQALKDGLKDVENKMKSGAGGAGGLGGMFGPDMWPKLQANAETREYLKDPSFVARLQAMQSNPNNLGSMLSDPRLSKALGVILGVDLTAMGANGMSMGGPPGGPARGASGSSASGVEIDEEDSDDDGDDSMVKDETKKPAGRKFKQTAEMSPEEARAAREATFKAAQKPVEPEKELTEEEKAEKAEREAAAKAKAEADRAKAKIRADADKEKTVGNDLYKKRDFAGAVAAYERARTIDPSNIVYYNNLGAVYMEQKDYVRAIEIGIEGARVGKENQANYADVAKAYARIGAAYQAQGDLDHAIEYLNKSLLEDYTDKTKQTLKKLEAEKKKKAEEAYIDPVKSEEHKAKGNELYNAGKFVDAIQEYSESIKRDPKNYKVYSNRAACYTKMMDWQRGLDDCEKVRHRRRAVLRASFDRVSARDVKAVAHVPCLCCSLVTVLGHGSQVHQGVYSSVARAALLTSDSLIRVRWLTSVSLLCRWFVWCVGKGKIQHFLKQYHKALSTFDQALEIEKGNAEVLEAKRATMIAIQSSESDPDRAKEAMKDPEIQQVGETNTAQSSSL